MAGHSHGDGSYVVPERRIPVPRHLSPDAQVALSAPLLPGFGYPQTDDPEAWRQFVAMGDAYVLQMYGATPEVAGVTIAELREGEALAYDMRPAAFAVDDHRVYLSIHGGGLIACGGPVCRAMESATTASIGARVIAVDYRMPPDHPFPVPVEDCLAFYRRLLRDHAPREIVVGGASAGGNLAVAMLLRARDEGLPLPAGLVLQTPEVDLTESGDSFATNMGVDRVLRSSLMAANLLYAGGADLSDPRVSPLFGDFAAGFPPTLLTTGTRDLFLSNTVRMHRKLRQAGICADLLVFEALSHGAYGNAPEDAEIAAEIRAFCATAWRRAL